ncbi:zinc finger protein 436-like [Scaptodrosophila lebanonensis]|uniref:Zinc finger protein 436-like n=1 Tax=Drosophila lebanonensis TaxID=7225 RepID=A0A6J2TI20_DROLE|nr:zinc finger protein 436-like [Scaptodrosophila lebanonensis]
MSVRCRTCGEIIVNLNAKPLFNQVEDEILRKIEAITGIWLSDEPGMPENICACCLLDLNHAISFRERCIKTNRLLFSAKQGKYADFMKEHNVELGNIDPLDSFEIYEDSEDLDGAVNVKIQLSPNIQPPVPANISVMKRRISPMLAHILKEERALANAKCSIPVSNKRHHTDVPAQRTLQPRAVDQSETTQICKASSISKILPKDLGNISSTGRFENGTGQFEKINLSNKTFKKPTNSAKRSISEKITKSDSTKTPEFKGYVCDQCGKRINNKSNLKQHLVRHTGIKKFQCQECDNKYFTLHLLKLHIRVRHKGEKPYGCNYCDQRFYTSPSRCRHERTHLSKPPFECEICSKGFLSKSCLVKHQILHTGERPFRCDICNIAFQRSEYLRIHNRSKMHLKKAGEAYDKRNDTSKYDGSEDDCILEDVNEDDIITEEDMEFYDVIIEELES